MKRIEKLLEQLDDHGIDALLINSEANITYLTGFTGDSSRLVVSGNGTCFITDGRYTEQAKTEIHEEIEILKWLNDDRYGGETYNHTCEKFGIRKLGFEKDLLTFSEYTTVREGVDPIGTIPVSGLVEALRMVKEEAEIDLLRSACKVSDIALERLLPLIKPGVTELELSAQLEYELKMAGSEGISFNTIVLFGNRTSLLHGMPGNTKLKKGDLILFDFGGMTGGYHADMSRSFVCGKASAEQKELYNKIKMAQESAVDSISSGVAGNYPDTVARQNLGEKYISYYYPGLGHGVGLEIHEQPFMKSSSEFEIAAGMTVTVEPGCYIPGWGGIRIEDTIVATDSSPEILTNFPKAMMEL